jgi:heterotetrameric sarcosine oxidase gamma subunit
MDAHISQSDLQKLDVRGQIAVASPAKLWQLTPRHALVTSPEPIAYEPSWAITDVSSVYSAVRLTGANAKEVLQKLTTLNVNEYAMPAGAARHARLAHVNAIILREPDAFVILNTRDVALHVWDALAHAGGQP